MDPSFAFQQFLDSLSGATADSKDCIDIEAMFMLEESERITAESMLIDLLEGDDCRIPAALASIWSINAVEPLEKRLATATGVMRISIARALVRMCILPNMDNAIAATLAEPEENGPLAALDAARWLKPPSEALKRVLVDTCLNHPSGLVRGEAATTLLYACGVTDDPDANEHIALRRPFYLEDAGLRQLAFDDLSRLVR